MPQNPIWRPQATGNAQLDEILRQITSQIQDVQKKVQPTTSIPASSATVAVANQPLTGFGLTASTLTNIGNRITINLAGTYLFIYALEAASGTTTLVHGFLAKNGAQFGINFNVAVNTIGSNLGFFLITANAGDTLQTQIKSDATATFNLIVQTVLLKLF